VSRPRQPAGVPVGGQFATTTHFEADLTLSEPARICSVCGHRTKRTAGAAVHNPPTDSAHQQIHPGDPLCAGASEVDIPAYLDELTRVQEAKGWASFAMVPYMRSRLDDVLGEAAAAGFPDVPSEYAATLLAAHDRATAGTSQEGPLGHWGNARAQGPMIGRAYETDMPVDWPETMALRGVGWDRRCVQDWNDGLTADELERLDTFGLAPNRHTAKAYMGCDGLTVQEWLAAAKADPELGQYLQRYLTHTGVGQAIREGVPLDDVTLTHRLGMEPGVARSGLTRPDGTQETGPAAIHEIHGYKTACGMSEDQAREGIRAGVSAAAVKAFGPKVTPSEIPAIQAAGVPPKVARSLRGRDARMDPATMAQLNAAGITTGPDYRAWTTITQKESDPVGAACALSKAGVGMDDANRLHGQRIPVGAIPDMVTGGVTDWSAWAPGIVGRTQGTDASLDNERAFRRIGSFAQAGGTREQFARAQKAGVALADLPDHAHSSPAQLWAAGAANRAAALAVETRRHQDWGGEAPGPWPFNGPKDLG